MELVFKNIPRILDPKHVSYTCRVEFRQNFDMQFNEYEIFNTFD